MTVLSDHDKLLAGKKNPWWISFRSVRSHSLLIVDLILNLVHYASRMSIYNIQDLTQTIIYTNISNDL